MFDVASFKSLGRITKIKLTGCKIHMKTIVEQLSNYKSVHLNRKNIKTHFVGVPLIIFSVALLLAIVNFEISIQAHDLSFSLATVVSIFVLTYYFVLSRPLAIMVIFIFGPLIYAAHIVATMESPLIIAVAVFIVGWIIQFIGHAYEKAKPAFFDDINQLSIGPIFLISEIYFALGFDKEMEKEVIDSAVELRRTFERKKREATS